jgi:glycosyltransferase involved in cell wall biosynthesis
MIIQFDNVNFQSRTGPNTFAQRLAKSFIDLGHKVTSESKDANVSLVFIEPSGRTLSNRIVQRLDGIWFKPEEFLEKNTRIKKTYETSDCVIWQSEFDKSMVTNWWGLPRKGEVIRNGITIEEKIDENLKIDLENLRNRYDKIFISSANWHPQKRLGENLRLFEQLKKKYKNSCLIVMGNNASVSGGDVYVTGNLNHDQCIQVFKNSDWMLHLAWLDHCPNTVVEALSCNVPVICSEDGGTKEIVGRYGIVLRENSRYNFELVDYDRPPSLDLSQLKELPPRESLGEHCVESIESTAKKYLRTFESIL